jgi:hypothetical protein
MLCCFFALFSFPLLEIPAIHGQYGVLETVWGYRHWRIARMSFPQRGKSWESESLGLCKCALACASNFGKEEDKGINRSASNGGSVLSLSGHGILRVFGLPSLDVTGYHGSIMRRVSVSFKHVPFNGSHAIWHRWPTEYQNQRDGTNCRTVSIFHESLELFSLTCGNHNHQIITSHHDESLRTMICILAQHNTNLSVYSSRLIPPGPDRTPSVYPSLEVCSMPQTQSIQRHEP